MPRYAAAKAETGCIGGPSARSRKDKGLFTTLSAGRPAPAGVRLPLAPTAAVLLLAALRCVHPGQNRGSEVVSDWGKRSTGNTAGRPASFPLASAASSSRARGLPSDSGSAPDPLLADVAATADCADAAGDNAIGTGSNGWYQRGTVASTGALTPGGLIGWLKRAQVLRRLRTCRARSVSCASSRDAGGSDPPTTSSAASPACAAARTRACVRCSKALGGTGTGAAGTGGAGA